MRILISLLSVFLHAWVVTANTDNHRFQDFQNWKQVHSKSYNSLDLELKAFKTWNSNYDLVENVNKNNKYPKWKAELNRFADLTSHEFQTQILMPPRKGVDFPNTFNISQSPKALPENFDWRTDGATPAVTRVRDQGSAGTCWSFSAVENVEGQWALAGNTLVELSPEFLVDCDGTNDGNHADCSVFGGWPYLAYQYIINAGGIPSETQWPYCSGSGNCYPCMAGPVKLCGPPPYYCDETISSKCKSFSVAAKISSWAAVSTNEEDIKSVLVSQGPLSVLLDATQLQFYQSGIWDGHIPGSSPWLGCSKSSLDHAVLLVGYGMENNVPYWTVKNSWGEKWGEQGYFRITRGSGTCGINTAVTTSLI